MPKNEDGEFELILGNRQLLSVFFIVVILLGVFFTMGYIVGRNSSPVTGPEVAVTRKPEQKPLVVDSSTPEPLKPAPADTPSAPPQTATQLPPVERTKPAEPARESKVETKREPVRPEKSSSVAGDLPASGQVYLQIAATGKREADIEVDLLRKNGFKAIDSEVPEKPGVYRVLVGPLHDGEVNKARLDLKAKGFPGDIAFKKIF